MLGTSLLLLVGELPPPDRVDMCGDIFTDREDNRRLAPSGGLDKRLQRDVPVINCGFVLHRRLYGNKPNNRIRSKVKVGP